MSDDKLKAQAYGAAVSRLKDMHRAEYRGFLEQEFEMRGLTYRPRPTPFDAAQAQIRAWVEEFGVEVLPIGRIMVPPGGTAGFVDDPLFDWSGQISDQGNQG